MAENITYGKSYVRFINPGLSLDHSVKYSSITSIQFQESSTYNCFVYTSGMKISMRITKEEYEKLVEIIFSK